MSYSFTLRAPSRDELNELIEAKFDEIVAGQPVHAADREAAQNAAEAFVTALPDTDGKDFSVTVSGSVSWSGTYPDDYAISVAGASITASLVDALPVAEPASGGGGQGDPDRPH